jgi:hypothetical protein
MSQDQPNPSNIPPGTPDDNPKQPAPTPRKRRKWPWVVASLFVALVLLVLLAPTIISTSFGRNIAERLINDNLNGRVEIADWSLGWFSRIKVSGVKVYDQQNVMVLDVPRIELGASLLDLVGSKLDLGDSSVIDVSSFVVKVDESGETNLQRLPKGPRLPRPESPEPARLPDVTGKFMVNLQGTITAPGVSPQPDEPAKPVVVNVDPSTAVVTITDINTPFQTDVKLRYRVNDGEPSVLEASGTVGAIRNNLVDVKQLVAGQKVSLANVDLAAVEPFLKTLGADTRVAGIVNGGLDVKAEGLTGISTAGAIELKDFVFAGGPIGADEFKQPRISIPVNITRTVVDSQTTLIKFDNVGVQMAEANLKVTGQVSQQALMNLADMKPPGGTGTLAVVLDVTDVPGLASQLKHTLRLDEKVQLKSGMVHEALTVAIAEQTVTVSHNLKASAEGINNGKAVTLQPIVMAASATARPTGMAIPDVTDIKLSLDSSFARMNGGGASLAKLLITGNFDLSKLGAELRQFADIGRIELAGTGDFKVATDGDLASSAAPVTGQITANLNNVKVIGLADDPIDQDRLAVVASGVLRRDRNVIDSGYLEVTSGDPTSPMLEVYANATVDLNGNSLPWFELVKCDLMNLAKLQQQYGGFVPALAANKIKIDGGSLHARLAGAFDGTTFRISKPLSVSVPGLSVSKQGKPILAKETITAAVDGSVALKDGIDGKFTDLSITSQSKLFDLSKTGNGPLHFTMTKQAVRGAGTMSLLADLPRLSSIAQAFGDSVQVTPETPQLSAGQLNGTVAFTRDDLNRIKFAGQITGLTMAVDGKNELENEQMTLDLTASAPDDLASRPVEAAGTIKSKIVNTTLSSVKLIPQGGLYGMVQSAEVHAQAPNLKMVMALVNAFSPVLGDVQVTGGGATVQLALARNAQSNTTSIDVSDCRINKLSLRRQKHSYAFDRNTPITLKLKASLGGSSQLESITVDELSGDLRVAALSMPQKLVLKMGPKPSYQGAIKLEGKLDDITPLLAVVRGAEPMPYGGAFVVSQQVATRDGKATVSGTADVKDFQVLDGRKAVFTEPQVAIRNDMDVDLTQQKLAVKTFTVEMPTSKALSASFTGGVNFWLDRREIRPGTKLDLTYDLAKLWEIVYPMLSPDQQESYKDLKISGRDTKSFVLSGAFPARRRLADSIKSLSADGGFEVESLQTMGLAVRKLDPQVKMTRGVVKLYAKPAEVNEGKLDVDGIILDLTSSRPLLTIPPKKVLLQNVKLNPILATQLGKLGAVLFTDAKKAEGQLKLTIVECNQVPVTALTKKSTAADASIELEVDSLHLDGTVPQILSRFAQLDTDGIRGKVPASTVRIHNGQADSNLTVLIARREQDERGRERLRGMPITLVGGVGLARLDLRDYVVTIPLDLLHPNWRKYMPSGAKLPMKGFATAPKIDESEIVKENLPGVLEGIGEHLRGGQRDRREDDRPRERGR